ncbi:hypothetical protein EDC04DRAFT_3088289 [Pisolithus marmoratus]|nr:hypothetical protein EDC04DRAFT_3088289 [Pisolithus marmoratus]
MRTAWLGNSDRFLKVFGNVELLREYPYFLACAVPATFTAIAIAWIVTWFLKEELFPSAPIPMLYDLDLEAEYNMDPTSLVLFAIELLDIRKDREEAFERFVGAVGPGQPCQEAGLLHPEGATSVVLSASYATLSLIRVLPQPLPENGAEVWQRDRDAASCYFDRARAMNSDLDFPAITDERSGQTRSVDEFEMPSLNIAHRHSASESAYSGEGSMYSEQERVIRRRRQGQTKDELIFIDDVEGKDDIDNAWYLITGVGVIDTLSFSSWRRNQGSIKSRFSFLAGIVRARSGAPGRGGIVTPPVRLQHPDDHVQSPITTVQNFGR